jgi:hypothetical protein
MKSIDLLNSSLSKRVSSVANIGSTGTRTISSYGLATIVFITPNAAVISGQGVS